MEQDATRPAVHPAWWLAGLALILSTQISSYWYPTVDACSYLSMARSIAEGRGLENLGNPHLWYAPGYPLIISPLFWVSERPLLAISIFQWAELVAFSLGVYLWARRNAPEAAVWIMALAVINGGVWLHLRRTLTEVTFITLLIWTVNSVQAMFDAPSGRRIALWAIPSVVLTILLCLVRQAGVTLVAGVAMAALLWAIRGKVSWTRAIGLTLLITTTAAVCVGGLIAREKYTQRLTGARTYLDNFSDSTRTPLASAMRGLQMCISEAGRAVTPGMFKAYGPPGRWTNVNMLLYASVFLLVAWGWWKWARRNPDPLAWMFPFYIALHAAYALDSGARFAITLVPVMLLSAWIALERITAQRRIQGLAALLAAHLAFAFGYWLGVDLPRTRQLADQWPAVNALAAAIDADPGPVAVGEDVSTEVRKMLDLTRDERTWTFDAKEPPPQGTALRWVVSKGRAPPQGFTLVCTAGDYLLFSARR